MQNSLSRLVRHCAAGISIAVASPVTAWPQAPEGRPNIVFIVADDLGYADLSGYGRRDYETPALDRLAAEGIRFAQAYSAAPVCSPTRVAFMTGRYPARSPVGLWEPLTCSIVDRVIGLSADQATVSSLLKAQGYATGLIGKWHLGSQPEHHPNQHGFDEFFGTIEGASDYISHVNPQGRPDLFHNQTPVKRPGYLTDLLTAEAVSFIARPRTVPFFLSVQYTAPHWPWQGPHDAATLTHTDPSGSATEPMRDAVSDWRRGGSQDTYAAMMRRLDVGISEILATLDKLGLRDNTLVIFTSDNGGEQFSDMGELRGNKMQLWEGGIRVPAIMRWPGVLAAGRNTDQTAITMDWTATILTAAGVPPDPHQALDGIDLLPLCRDDAPVQTRTLAWRTFQRTKQNALRRGDWKYLHDGTSDHLFNVALDPGERHDLKAEHPERIEELKRLFLEWEKQMLPPVTLENQVPVRKPNPQGD